MENRGERMFVQLRAAAVVSWLARPIVKDRLNALASGHQRQSTISETTRWEGGAGLSRPPAGRAPVGVAKLDRLSLGLEAQRAAVQAFATAEGFTIVAEFTEIAFGLPGGLERRLELRPGERPCFWVETR
jgi:hypothetical protein